MRGARPSVGAIVMALLAMSDPAPRIAAAASVLGPSSNPIVVENALPGVTTWQIGRDGHHRANDVDRQVKGYASATSVNVGEIIDLHVSVNPAQTFTIDVYRIGWYGGAGGRLMTSVGPLDGTVEPDCPPDPVTGRIACTWAIAHSLAIPPEWTSGVFIAVLTNAAGYQNDIIFTVRDDDRPAELLYQSSVNTWQAYNNYPNDGLTGKSLYSSNSYGANTAVGSRRATKVSFDRPYANDGGAGSFLDHEIDFVRWAERTGYDLVYSTDVDTHMHPERLLRYEGFLSIAHDEYWSLAMVDGVVVARDAGVDLGFFGGNTMYWQVRFEDGGRTMVCFRSAASDPVNGPETTVLWRDPPVSRPEQHVLGNMTGVGGVAADFVVRNDDHWVYRDTGLHDGDVIVGIMGYEVDTVDRATGRPPNRRFTFLGRSPVVDGAGFATRGDTVIYQAPNRAWVFAAGSIWWSFGLDGYVRDRADPRAQQMTRNILDRFVRGPSRWPVAVAAARDPVLSAGA